MIHLTETLTTLSPKVGTTLFIAIDGHGGSGKSSLAEWVSEKLDAEIIHTDDFSGWNNPLNWWLAVVNQVFEPIKSGATTLSYQPASWWENHHPVPVINQPVTPIMILEGVSSSRKEFDEYLSLRIFVDTPKEICLARGIQRDTSTGKPIVELTEMWKNWFAKEDEYFQRDNPKEKADSVILGTIPFAEQIQY